MDFSGAIATATAVEERAAVAAGFACRFEIPKYTPPSASRQTAAIPMLTSSFLRGRLVRTDATLPVFTEDSSNRCPTSDADCGRRAGSLARQAATVSSHAAGTSAGSMLN